MASGRGGNPNSNLLDRCPCCLPDLANFPPPVILAVVSLIDKPLPRKRRKSGMLLRAVQTPGPGGVERSPDPIPAPCSRQRKVASGERLGKQHRTNSSRRRGRGAVPATVEAGVVNSPSHASPTRVQPNLESLRVNAGGSSAPTELEGGSSSGDGCSTSPGSSHVGNGVGEESRDGQISGERAQQTACPPLRHRAPGEPYGATKAQSLPVQQILQAAKTPVEVRESQMRC